MQTLLATFDDNATAQRAIEALLDQGFDRSHVHLETAPGSQVSGTAEHSSEQGIMSSVGNFFSNLFGSDSDSAAGNYSEAVRRGSSVVAVDAEDDAQLDQAREIMQDMGSVDVEARVDQWKQQGWTGFDPNSEPLTENELERERQAVPVVQEELQVGKRAVDVGGLRVIKRVSETPVSEIVNLREEHATIERRPVDRPATEADFANFQEGTLEVRETAEEAIVGKTARVVEEVVVGKEETERSETIEDTVRRTDVDVERIPPGNNRNGRGTRNRR
jgi:uncharacterized protein (TIGR02271 family)